MIKSIYVYIVYKHVYLVGICQIIYLPLSQLICDAFYLHVLLNIYIRNDKLSSHS